MSNQPDTIFNSLAFQHLSPLLIFSTVSLIQKPSCVGLTAEVSEIEELKLTKPELNNDIVPVATLGLVSSGYFLNYIFIFMK